MAYEKQTWTTGEVITQEKLNHMEDGIASAGGEDSIVIVDVSGTNMSADDYTKALNTWYKGMPVIAKLGGQLQFAYMTGAEISMGGATLLFEYTYIDHTDNTLRWFEYTVNTPNLNYSISSSTKKFDLSSLVKN